MLFCKTEFEIFQHLLYKVLIGNEKLKLTNLTKMIKDRKTLGLPFLVAKFIWFWFEDESNYMANVYFIADINLLFVKFALLLLICCNMNNLIN